MADTPAFRGRGAAYSDFAQRQQAYQAKVDAHRNPPKQTDDSWMKYVPDVAGNAAQQAYQEARVQQQGDLPYESRSLSLPFRSTYQPSIAERLGQAASGIANIATGAAAGITGTGRVGQGVNQLQTADMHNLGPEYYSQAQYLPEKFPKQNVEIAIARALGTNPSLVKKPALLFAAATQDMKAHDIQRLATYSDFADAYNAMLTTPDGFVNASKTMTDRMSNQASKVPGQAAGKVLDTAIHLIGAALTPLGKALNISGANGGSTMNVTVANQPMVLGPNVPGAIVKDVGEGFNAAFDVQHTVRALHDIRATQGDGAYYQALTTVVGTAVATTFAMDGLGKVVLHQAGRALTDALIANGIDTTGLDLAELRALAEKSGVSPEAHKAWLRAAAKWLSKLPPSIQPKVVKILADVGHEGAVPGASAVDTEGGVTAYSREGGLGLTKAEEDALSGAPIAEGELEAQPTDIFNRLGNFVGRASGPTGKVLSNTVGLPFKYPKLPMNFQLASQLLFNTNGLGMGDHWKDSWDRTADGRTYVDPHTKRAVSLGREVADVFGGKPNDWWYSAVSGPLDLFTQFALDPTMAVLKPMSAAKHLPPLRSRTDVYNMMATDLRAQEMADAIVRINVRSKVFRDAKIAEERKILESSMKERRKKLRLAGASPEQIAQATSSPKWRPTDAQLEALVRNAHPEADSYADLLRLFPQLSRPVEGEEPALDFIAKLTTAESRNDVADILGDMAAANAMLDPYRLPSYGQFTRMKDYLYEKNRQAIAEGDLSVMGKMQKTLARGAVSIKPTYFQDLRQFSNKLARVGSPASLDLIRRTFLAAGRSPGEVDLLINRLARTTNDFEWRTIYKNFVQDQFHIEAKAFVDDLVETKGFSPYEAATLRNALERPFRSVIEQLSETAGGGASAAAYTGTKHNYVASMTDPLSSDMRPTAGLLGAHEHYFALPDYVAWDKFKADIVKGLRDESPDGLKTQMYNASKDIVAKPFDDQIAALTSRNNELVRQIAANRKAWRATAETIKQSRESNVGLQTVKKYHESLLVDHGTAIREADVTRAALKQAMEDRKTLTAAAQANPKNGKAISAMLQKDTEVERLREELSKKIDKVDELKAKLDESKKAVSAANKIQKTAEAPHRSEQEQLNQKTNQLKAQIDAYKQQIKSQALERDAAIVARLGNFKDFKVLDKAGMDAKNVIYNFHDSVRHWFIDKYFRQAVLATGSFSMRVAAAEAIANTFRVGAREYSKGWLANRVAKGIAEASGVGAKQITEEERNIVMSMVHDVLTQLRIPKATGAVKGSINSFLEGLSSGLGMDDFVELLSRDIIERGGTLWGINASHGAMDAVKFMHNLSSGYGTGNWEFRNTLDNDSLSGLTKSLNDTAHFAPARKTAEILDRNLDPATEIATGPQLSSGAQYVKDAVERFQAKGNTIELYGGGQTDAETLAQLEKDFAPLKEAGYEGKGSQGRTRETLRAGSANAAYEAFRDSGMHLIVARNAEGKVIGALDFWTSQSMFTGDHIVEIHLIGSTEKDVGPAMEHHLALIAKKQLKNASLTTDIAHGSTPYHEAVGRTVEPVAKPFIDARGRFTPEQMDELANIEINAKPSEPADVYKRLEVAREENRAAIRRMVARDPKKYEAMLRSGAFINDATHQRLAQEVMQELGVTSLESQQARNLLLIKQSKINPVDEWADALFEHVLWLSHGRGKTNDLFDSANISDKIFHRHVLKMLAEGKAPYTPELTRDLYIKPDLEQARVMTRQNMKRAKGVEKSSYHSHLYGSGGTSLTDLSTLSDAEIAHLGLPSRRLESDEALTPTFEGMKGQDVHNAIIEANTPMKTGFKNKFAGKNKNTVSRMYEDINGETTSRFPANIPTQVPLPSSRSSALEAISSKTIDKGAEWVHDTISTPVINTIAREPLYAVEFAQQMNALKPLVKDGTLPLEVAMNTARVRAIEHAIKFVHNPQDRFVFEQWARAFAPFWFAKNQAMRRAGRLAITNPMGFERYLRAMLVMQNYGAASATNNDNQSAILMPGSMMGGRLMTDFMKTIGFAPAGGVPLGLRGSTSSLASVFPWTDPSGENPGNAISLAESMRPDFGPMVSLPIRALAMANPYNHGIQQLNDKALGALGSRSSLFQQMVPNSLVRSVISMGSSWMLGGRNQTTAAIDALQTGLMAQYLQSKHKELAKGAAEQAQFDWSSEHDKFYTAQHPEEYKAYVDAMTTAYVNEGIWYGDKEVQKPISYYYSDPHERTYAINRAHKAALAIYAARTALSFFSPLSLTTTEVNPEMRSLIRDAQGTGGDFTKAEALYNKHPDAIYYVAHGTATQTGVPLPATLDMSKFQNENADLFRKGGNASGLIAFVPYTNKGDTFDSNEYHNQLAAGLRRSLTPPEFLDKMAAAVGNNYVYNYLPKLNDKFEGGNTESLRRAKALYSRANPLWAKTLGDSKKSRINALDQVRQLLTIPGINSREGFKTTAPRIREMVAKYDEFTQRYKNADSGWHTYLEDQWQNWLKEYSSKHKEITIGANAIFKGLKLSDNTGN